MNEARREYDDSIGTGVMDSVPIKRLKRCVKNFSIGVMIRVSAILKENASNVRMHSRVSISPGSLLFENVDADRLREI
jgi:hypothetical protein